MRTSIVVDDLLMSRALQSSGCATKQETIEAWLRLLVQVKSQQELRRFKDKISWEGDLDDTRGDSSD